MDKAIDALVYVLYVLTPEGGAVVARSLTAKSSKYRQ